MDGEADMHKRKQDRLSRVPEGAVLGVSIAIVLVIGGLSYSSARSAERASTELNLARNVANLDQELLSALKDAETGQRGFLLTGREPYLEPYSRAVSVVPGLLKRLESLTQPAPDQSEILKTIEPLVAAKLSELKQTIDLRRANNSAQALAIVNGDTGKAFMDDIRTRCAALDRIVDQRLVRFTTAADSSSSRLRIVATVGSALLLAFLAISTATIFRGLNRRDELYGELFESERKLAVTLSSIADGVISTDASARIIFLNPVAEHLTGWRQSEGVGRPVTEVFRIVNEMTRQVVANPLEEAMAEGRAAGLANHTTLIARDGREIFIDDSAAPIRNETGNLIGGVLVFRDISERRKSEQELAQSALALQRSNEELQQFAFAASHDLRSPLRSMSSMAELLEAQFSDKLGEYGSRIVGYITDAAARMTRLIDDLLALARETGLDRETPDATSMQDAFNAACNSLHAEIEEAGATITASPLPLVAARDTHVVLVLQNLLANALKYRASAPPRIDVSAVQKESEWIIGVKDNGIGIDPQFADQIFQPFKRLHGQEYEGTGIGLWSCKKIVSAYGGRIWVESAAGNGCTFFFSLPAASLPSTTATAGTATASA